MPTQKNLHKIIQIVIFEGEWIMENKYEFFIAGRARNKENILKNM